MAANALRMRRLVSPAGALLMLPMDHGISMGAVSGLLDPAKAYDLAARGGATCITAHKGVIATLARHLDGETRDEGSGRQPRAERTVGSARSPGILLHLSASTDLGPDPNDKRIVATVREAVALGCDGVSIHVNLGSPTEALQLSDAGRVAADCADYGMPLVAMVYPRGAKIPKPGADGYAAAVAHAARLGYELGADAVKVPYTGDAASFRIVAEACPVPVLVAGGAKQDSFKAFLAQVRAARDAGARGVSVGRNVFQQPDPAAAMAALAKVFG